MRFVNRTTASIAALTVLGVGAGGVAYADSGLSTAGHTGQSGHHGTRHGMRHRLPVAARALHGELVLGGKQRTVTADVQRGAVTAVSSTSLTMRSLDGFSQTYAITPQTKVRSMGKQLSIGDVKTGERAFVIAIKRSDGSLTARAIRGVREPSATATGSASSAGSPSASSSASG